VSALLLMAALGPAFGQDKPQFQLGDALSVYSDRAFRKEGGDVFEAVGNVVIVSGKDTLYGEAATLDRREMRFQVEGNVRLITGDMTLYGSRLDYHAASGFAEVENARIVNAQYNVVARRILRRAERTYEAQEAEFTTCRDCVESWAVYGRKMVIHLEDRAIIHHGLLKVKGNGVLYLPYFVVPLSKRKTGLLFPNVFNRIGEGMGVSQPFFWAIDDSKDATLSPTFWATRGYGSDVEYRQRFAPERWFEGSTRVMNDKIYEPGRGGSQSESNVNYTRYFGKLENHWMWNPDWGHHLRHTSARDLDMVRDHPEYTERGIIGSELGFQGHVDGRGDLWALSLQSTYQRNLLFDEPAKFDRDYVQTLPRVAVGTTPIALWQGRTPGLQHLSVGADGSFTRFRQVNQAEDTDAIRNADRITALPYLNWHLFTWGPLSLRNETRYDYQAYRFSEVEDRVGAEKSATMHRTELAFTLDRVFGLSYEEKIPWTALSPAERKAIRDKKVAKGQVRSSVTPSRPLVGQLPDFESSITDEMVPVQRQAYRHSQEYKLIHHRLSSETYSGNARFKQQIATNQGWFDIADAVRSQEYQVGANTARTLIPLANTLELQWNNSLISKTPSNTDWRTDQRYLRDNFSYSKTGYFNVSQGYIFDEELVEFREKLTRLAISAGYGFDRWSLNLTENFFHLESDHIFQLGAQRRFDLLYVMANYNYNSSNPAGQPDLHTLGTGVHVRPTDFLGLSMVKQMNLNTKESLRTVYGVDIMPANNCWILQLDYRESVVGFQYSFDIMWNFGQEKFQQARGENWYSNSRVR
jgi:LPS-assembly protein